MKLGDFARSLALDVGEYIKTRRKQGVETMYKDNGEVVTNVDKEADMILQGRLNYYFPEHSILSEEGDIPERESEYLWVIDPIDGTENFRRGIGHYAISIAVLKNREAICGVIYDPVKNEMFEAEKGEGSTLNGRLINVGKNKITDDINFVYDFAQNSEIRSRKYINTMKSIASIDRRSGSTALDLAYLAAGRYDLSMSFGIKPWDIEAGKLIAKEAGAEILESKNLHHDIFATNSRIRKVLERISYFDEELMHGIQAKRLTKSQEIGLS